MPPIPNIFRRATNWGASCLGAALIAALGSPGPARAASDLLPEERSEDGYVESFTFIADLSDGTYVQLQLAVSNLGPGSGKGVCRVLVKRPGSAPFIALEHVSRDKWRHTAGEEERLSIGSCEAASGGATTIVRTPLGGAVIELRYAAPVSPALPPSPVLEVGTRWHKQWILHWATPVTARLTLPDAKLAVLTGGGYADHSRAIASAKELASAWLRFRSVRGPQHVVVLARKSPDGKLGPIWLRREGAAAPAELTGFTLSREGPRLQPAWKANLSGEGLRATLQSGELLYRSAPLDELGLLGKLLSPMISVPITYTHRGVLKLEGGPEVEGVMEVELFEE
jgi:hypothetical protein